MKVLAVLIISSFYLIGCASSPSVPKTINDNAKVGLLLLIEDNPKHYHIGTTMFQNFDKPTDYDWGLNNHISDYTQQLFKNSSYSFGILKPSSSLKEHKGNFIKAGWVESYINENAVIDLKKINSSHNYEYLIILVSKNKQPDKQAALSLKNDGYGIYSRCAFNSCIAKPLINISVYVVHTKDMIIKSNNDDAIYNNVYSIERKAIPINPDTLKLSESELKMFKETLYKYSDIIVNEAIKNAGFKIKTNN